MDDIVEDLGRKDVKGSTDMTTDKRRWKGLMFGSLGLRWAVVLKKTEKRRRRRRRQRE